MWYFWNSKSIMNVFTKVMNQLSSGVFLIDVYTVCFTAPEPCESIFYIVLIKTNLKKSNSVFQSIFTFTSRYPKSVKLIVISQKNKIA